MKKIENQGIEGGNSPNVIPLTEKRKEQIINATCQSIVEKGYSAVTTQDIADRTGLSKGMIHYYFNTKENLLIAVMKNLVNQWDWLIADKLKGIKNPTRAIYGLFDACGEIAQDRVSYEMLVKFWAEMGQTKAFEELNANFYSHYREMIKDIIEEGINQGQFKKVDSYLLATILISIIDGLSLQWLFEKDAFSFTKAKKMVVGLILAFLQKE